MRPAQRLKVFLSQAPAAGYFAVKKGTQTQALIWTQRIGLYQKYFAHNHCLFYDFVYIHFSFQDLDTLAFAD